MGEQTEAIKFQQSEWAPLSGVLRAQLLVIGALITPMVDSCYTARPEGVPPPTATYVSCIIGIVLAVFTIFERFVAQGPLTWSRPADGSGGPPVPPKPDQRGLSRVELLLAILAGVIASLLIGCSTIERSGETLTFRLRKDPKRPPPACLYELDVDGELLHHGAIGVCPAAPVCEEP